MTPERMEWHLDNWAKSMRYGGAENLGVKISSLYSSGGVASEDEFDIMADAADRKSARAFGACYDSLPKPQRTAIDHIWLSAAFCWETQDMDYEDAINNLHVLVEKRGIL